MQPFGGGAGARGNSEGELEIGCVAEFYWDCSEPYQCFIVHHRENDTVTGFWCA
jgi:hypothetical protein